MKASTRIPDLGNANVGIFKKTLAIPQKGIAYFLSFVTNEVTDCFLERIIKTQPRASHSKDLGKGLARLVMKFNFKEKPCKAETKASPALKRCLFLSRSFARRN